MNIYRITKYHPAWMQYQMSFDLEFISPGIKSTAEQRVTLQKEVVREYMKDFGLSEEALRKILETRTKEKIVHRLYGTD